MLMTEKERYKLALSKSRNSSKQRRLKNFADTVHGHPLWLQFIGLIETSEIKAVHYWAGIIHGRQP